MLGLRGEEQALWQALRRGSHNRHTGCLAQAQFILSTPLIECPGHEGSS